MAQREVLKELARQVRGDTLKVLHGTPLDRLTWAPTGTSNHILWHAGHALWLQDLMCVELLSGQSELPEGWAAAFGGQSQPADVREWPSVERTYKLLEAQILRMFELLDQASDEILHHFPEKKLSNRLTVLGWIVHGLHDEAKHNGEMYLLWKLCQTESTRAIR